MSAQKLWRLVCYDVRDDKRYRKAHKILRGAGHTVQYSIFRCLLDQREAERLKWELAKVLAAEDRLLMLDLCSRCAERVVARNQVDDWAKEQPSFRILPELVVQAPVGGDDVAKKRGPKSSGPAADCHGDDGRGT